MKSTLKILFFGDVVGSAGRRVVAEFLRNGICRQADLVMANVENSADSGFGICEQDVREFYDLGVDVLTGGNHSFHWDQTRFFIDAYPTLLRPANCVEGSPGRGWCSITRDNATVAVINVLGRLHMQPLRSPFEAIDELITEARKETNLIFVDIHAVHTGEKAALAHYLDGRVSVVAGTHTHVQTADERILPQGTAFITDVGACAAKHSIIGMEFEAVFKKLTDRGPATMQAAIGQASACAIVVELETRTGRAIQIERLKYEEGAGRSQAYDQPAHSGNECKAGTSC